jgi:hypothetical protein
MGGEPHENGGLVAREVRVRDLGKYGHMLAHFLEDLPEEGQRVLNRFWEILKARNW